MEPSEMNDDLQEMSNNTTHTNGVKAKLANTALKKGVKVVANKVAPGSGKIVSDLVDNNPKLASTIRSNSMMPKSMTGLVKRDSTLPTEEEKNELTKKDSSSASSNAESLGTQLMGKGKVPKNKLIAFLMKNPAMIAPIIIVGGVFIFIFFIILIVVILGGTDAEASTGSSGGGTNLTSSSAAVTDSCPQISVPIDEYLKEKGSSLEEFNNYIAYEVRQAGLGTREGVVTAALSLLGGLCQNFGGRFPYTMGGAHPSNFYGAKEIWGTSINNGAGEMRHGYGPYFFEGPDCSGFVGWAIYNGGFNFSSMVAANFGSLGATHAMSEFDGQAGDVLYNSHHVVLIVGEEGDSYLIAEASSGDNGSRITKEKKKSGNYTIVDMTSYYSNSANVKTDGYPEGKATNISSAEDESTDSSGNGSNNPTIFIGDSRTVGMCETYGLCEGEKYVAKVSMGYNWLANDAISQVDSILSQNSDTTYNIMINLGANDYSYQANNYISKINELASDKWSKHNIYFASVGPFSDDDTNVEVTSFNSTVSKGLDSKVKYCDVYTALKNEGFNTTDGVHYDKDTSEKMYNKMRGCL